MIFLRKYSFLLLFVFLGMAVFYYRGKQILDFDNNDNTLPLVFAVYLATILIYFIRILRKNKKKMLD